MCVCGDVAGSLCPVAQSLRLLAALPGWICDRPQLSLAWPGPARPSSARYRHSSCLPGRRPCRRRDVSTAQLAQLTDVTASVRYVTLLPHHTAAAAAAAASPHPQSSVLIILVMLEHTGLLCTMPSSANVIVAEHTLYARASVRK